MMTCRQCKQLASGTAVPNISKLSGWKVLQTASPPCTLCRIAKSSSGGQPAVTDPPVPNPLRRPRLCRTALANHRQDILRDRVECRHRLRVRLERPLRHNQIRKLCRNITLDCSNAASSRVPRPPAPATPTLASPDAAVVVKLLFPEAVNPSVLATVATAT